MSRNKSNQLVRARKSNGKVNPTASFELITPEMAEDVLENHNHINRPKRQNLAEKYTRERTDGNYILGWHAIAYDYNGELMNAQHTMMAILESGIAEEHLVVRGLDPRARLIGDTDAPRRPHDILKINGFDQATTRTTAVVRQMMNGLNKRATMTEIVKAYEKYEPAVLIIEGMFPGHRPKLTLSTVKAPMARALSSYPENSIQRFADILYNGIARRTKKGDISVILLRDYLLQRIPYGGDTGATEVYRKAESALYAFLTNTTLTKLEPSEEELFPLPDEE